MAHQTLAWTGLVIALAYYLYSLLSYRQRMRGAKAVPGPRGLPFVGNIPEVAKDPWLISTFAKWGKQYGPIVQFRLFDQLHIVLADEQMAVDLFVHRGENYSDRSRTPAMNEYTAGETLAMLDRGELLRRERRFFQNALTSTMESQIQPLMSQESILTLRNLLEVPSDFRNQMARYTYGIMARSALGVRVDSMQDPVIRANRHIDIFSTSCFRPDKFLINFFPFLVHAPTWLISDRARIARERASMVLFHQTVYDATREALEAGAPVDSFWTDFLQHSDSYKLTSSQAGAVMATLMVAGTRSPQNVLLEFLINMMENPKWLNRLHRELDAVVGPHRLPEFTDMPQLPVVRAIMTETVRLRSVRAELGVPHRTRHDDVYKGYFIPKGTVIWMNNSAISQEPTRYPHGDRFDPARYLDPSFPTYREPLTTYPSFTGMPAFSIGRRACPGRDFAERTLLLMAARLAWTFNITSPLHPAKLKSTDKVKTGATSPTPKADGASATESPSSDDSFALNVPYEPAPNPMPEPFECTLEPRDEGRVAVIRQLASSEDVNRSDDAAALSGADRVHDRVEALLATGQVPMIPVAA